MSHKELCAEWVEQQKIDEPDGTLWIESETIDGPLEGPYTEGERDDILWARALERDGTDFF